MGYREQEDRSWRADSAGDGRSQIPRGGRIWARAHTSGWEGGRVRTRGGALSAQRRLQQRGIASYHTCCVDDRGGRRSADHRYGGTSADAIPAEARGTDFARQTDFLGNRDPCHPGDATTESFVLVAAHGGWWRRVSRWRRLGWWWFWWRRWRIRRFWRRKF